MIPRILTTCHHPLLRASMLALLTLVALPIPSFTQQAATGVALRGDLNRDGEITALDAGWVLVTLVGRSLPQGFSVMPAGDADGNGQITSRDVLVILRYAVKEDVSEYPVGRELLDLRLTPETIVLEPGVKEQLTATATGTTGRLIWRSSAPTVASVDENGLVEALEEGIATISVHASADTTVHAIAAITVAAATAETPEVPVAAAAVKVSPAAHSFTALEQTLTARASVLDVRGQSLEGVSIAWASADTSIATVDSAGVITAHGAGSTLVSARAGELSSGVNITVEQLPSSIQVEPGHISFTALGDSAQLSALVEDARGYPISGCSPEWASLSPSIASMNAFGTVVARAVGTALITASCGSVTDTTVVDIEPLVAAVEVSPSAPSTQVGGSIQLAAVAYDSNGNPVADPRFSWASSDPTVATVRSGLVQGLEMGSATITATAGGKSAATMVQVGRSHSYFVAPSGSPSGTGSKDRPWDLATALAHPAGVMPGDTIWLRGGTYRGSFVSRINGGAGRPIVVRQYPGERATIDGNFMAWGSWTVYWGFEIMISDPTRVKGRPEGLTIHASNSRFINLVVHDAGQGVGFSKNAVDSELYGTIIYNNGYLDSDRGHGHAIYTQNETGTKRIEDNIVFNQFGWGLHAYTEGSTIRGFHIEGNVLFNNGTLSGGNRPDIIMAATRNPIERVALTENYTYKSSGTGLTAQFGYAIGNQDLSLTNNYFVGQAAFTSWKTLTATGNTFVEKGANLWLETRPGESASSYSWSNNHYFTGRTGGNSFDVRFNGIGQNLTFEQWRAATNLDQGSTHTTRLPTELKVFVRPNEYEEGRGHVIVYNWPRHGSVAVDVSEVLDRGAEYAVHSAQDLFGEPVASGSYGGGSINIPMDGVRPPAAIGGSATNAPTTGPEFDVFLITTRR